MSYIHSYGKSVRRYHSGTSDGLLYAGQEGVQLEVLQVCSRGEGRPRRLAI